MISFEGQQLDANLHFRSCFYVLHRTFEHMLAGLLHCSTVPNFYLVARSSYIMAVEENGK